MAATKPFFCIRLAAGWLDRQEPMIRESQAAGKAGCPKTREDRETTAETHIDVYLIGVQDGTWGNFKVTRSSRVPSN